MSTGKREREEDVASGDLRGEQRSRTNSDTPLTSRWTPEQDEQLRQGIEIYGTKNWKAIASMVPERNHAQCLQRWNKVLKPGLVKGHWSFDEDEALIKLVQGEVSVVWSDISKNIPGRTAKQCRERWKNHLDPSINKNPYKTEEDLILLNAFEELGNRWTQIAELLPGRTEDSVKARYKVLNPNHEKNKPKPGRPPLIAPPIVPTPPPSVIKVAVETPDAVTDTSVSGDQVEGDEEALLLSQRASSLLESFKTHDSLLSFTSMKAQDWEMFEDLMLSDEFASAVNSRGSTEMSTLFNSFKDKSMTDQEFKRLLCDVENPEAIMDFIQETYDAAGEGTEWDEPLCACGCGRTQSNHSPESLEHLMPQPIYPSQPDIESTGPSSRPVIQAQTLDESVQDMDDVEDMMTTIHTNCSIVLEQLLILKSSFNMVGAWTPHEDELLRRRVEKASNESWSKIAEAVPGRSSKQCRDRWRNHLDPSLIKTAFSTEEEIALENAYEELGNRWTEIAKRLPGRSEHDIKLRWKTMHPHRQDKSKARSFGFGFGSLKLHSNNNNDAKATPPPPRTQPAPQQIYPPPPVDRRRSFENVMNNDVMNSNQYDAQYTSPNSSRPRIFSNVMGDDMSSMLDEIHSNAMKRPYLEDHRRMQQEWEYQDSMSNHNSLTGSVQLSESFLANLRNVDNIQVADETQLVDSLFASFGPNDEEAIRRTFNLSVQEFDELLENKSEIKKSLSRLSLRSSMLSNPSFIANDDDINHLINSCAPHDNQQFH
ncbi:myb-like DNA-binding protein [Thraustotheca clavata]|uniref:Myb-like DNA-binding protein n=1 Tax=Thraustotheca clavata TaxID=74557 RepID=A0A1W0AB60_9STRA|nr:myb-like DNA-binding protein [Thraustotheca clavata]